MSNAILKRMPAGIAGAITRYDSITTDSVILDSTNPFTAFGLGGKYSSNKFIPIASGDAAAVLAGIYVRPFPTVSQPDQIQQTGTGKNKIGTILKRGYINVNIGVDASSLSVGAAVYMVVSTPTTANPLGSFTATSGANTVAITNAYFTGPGDTSGNIELAFNL